MAKKAAAPKKPVAKKAAASAKPVAKSEVKSEGKSKAAKPEAKKPTVMAAQKPAKKEDAPVKSQKVEAAPVAKPSKAAQPTENTEKIKIDRDKMTEDQIKWAEMYNKYRDTQASPYDMKSTFKSGAPLQHKVLGWGWIVSNDNDRLEVLFKDGKRMLISNYRG